MKIKQIAFLAAIVVASTTACKKSKVEPVVPTPPVTPTPTTPTVSRADLSRDSIFLYAKEIYYWNEKLPTYEVFNPRKYTSYSSNLDNYEQELFEIASYSSNKYDVAKNAGVYQNYPKYSYIEDRANKNPTASINAKASVDLEGNGNDVGIRFAIFTYSNDPGYLFYVGGVYENSPAEKAGMKRGDLITKINGTSFGVNYNGEVSALNAALGSSKMTIEGVKGDGSAFSYTLDKTVFKSSPIYKTKVITAGTKKVGYISYARFSSAANSETALTTAFNDFAAQGVTDLIVDFRYNGGGYVSTAEHLINLIAPSSVSGVMFAEHFNATMQSGNAKILANQPLLDANDKVQYRNGKMVTYADVQYTVAANTASFEKKGNLTNVTNVVFLVSGNTASASELVINSLKPHMKVSLVGRATYGKPIGFFPITIENKYDVYLSLFETKNSLGEGGYYDGIPVNVSTSELVSNAANNIFNKMYDFGDANDGLIKAALGIIAPGVVVTSQARVASTNFTGKRMIATDQNSSSELLDNEFKGMIENRLKPRN
ncbi:MAG: hypothetical protein EOP00_25195 [Pedobacter sp.]|nr:MAG: hypothetical protein EOP00_25195 [Pedobacter sp.]